MEVYLLRHGIAEEERLTLRDADRALTREGKKKLYQVLQTAAKADVRPSLILSSPLKRALQSAEIAKEVLEYGGEILQTNLLAPSSSVEQVWQEIRVYRSEASLLLTGHNPLFAHLAGYLLGQPNLTMEFKKGALLRVDANSFGPEPHGVLRWCLTAKLAHANS